MKSEFKDMCLICGVLKEKSIANRCDEDLGKDLLTKTPLKYVHLWTNGIIVIGWNDCKEK